MDTVNQHEAVSKITERGDQLHWLDMVCLVLDILCHHPVTHGQGIQVQSDFKS